MRIESKIKADLVGMKTQPNVDTKGKTTTVVIHCKVPSEKAEKLFGESFNRLAFGPRTVSADGKVDFGYDKIKPDLVVEKHMVRLVDPDIGPLPVMPELSSIVAGGKDDEVLAVFKLPLPIEKKSAIGDIWSFLGKSIEVEFNPTQMNLPLAVAAEDEKKPKRGRKKKSEQVAE